MSKEWVLERDWEILEALPAWYFKVKLKDVGTIVRCKKSGKMNQAHISLLPGDLVKIELMFPLASHICNIENSFSVCEKDGKDKKKIKIKDKNIILIVLKISKY